MGVTETLIKEHKKIVKIVGISLCTLLVIYFGMAAYFRNHFYFGSEINGVNVSGKSVEKVNELMTSKLQAYTLELKERGGKAEQIGAGEIGLKYSSEGEFRSFKDKQDPYKWVTAIFNTEASKMTEEIKYDEALLKERVDKLSLFEASNIIEPKNASFKYENNGYVIVDEVPGTKVNKDILYENIVKAISKEESTLDLEAIDCYVKPQYDSKSQKIVETKDMLNKYASSKITYTFGEIIEVLDGATINGWLTVDENFGVVLDEAKVKGYIDSLSKTFNTVGKQRSFLTSTGQTINIGGGDYGWAFSKAKETEALVAAIKEGQTVDKEPTYVQTALAKGDNDIGKTYVEIDLKKQYLWFYKDGALVTQGNIVTGNVSKNYTTPPGVYKLKYKDKNAVLRGPGYAAPVTYWMPFNGGIGIHDASWRSVFGGNIYRINGSHGCVNSPKYLAKAVYENIQPGVPVICY